MNQVASPFYPFCPYDFQNTHHLFINYRQASFFGYNGSKAGILPYVMRVYFSSRQRCYLKLLVPVLTVGPSTTSLFQRLN